MWENALYSVEIMSVALNALLPKNEQFMKISGKVSYRNGEHSLYGFEFDQPHTAVVVVLKQFMARRGVVAIDHPPYTHLIFFQ